MVVRRRRKRWAALVLLVPALLLFVALGLTGYLDARAFNLEAPTAPRRDDLVAVYWTGDMGMHVGMGRTIIDRMRGDGIPVLTASSPVLFARGRDADYAERMIARSLRLALSEARARRVAVVASSFGSDMVVASLGRVAPDLRARLAAVVLVGPGRTIYFHANPTGVFYKGPSEADPAKTLPRLWGLPLTCIYGMEDDDTLCREPPMIGARRVMIRDGHMMLHSHGLVADAALDGVRRPPPAFTPR